MHSTPLKRLAKVQFLFDDQYFFCFFFNYLKLKQIEKVEEKILYSGYLMKSYRETSGVNQCLVKCFLILCVSCLLSEPFSEN